MGFGIYTRLKIENKWKFAFACSCGHKYNTNERIIPCSNCGNGRFKRVYNGMINGNIEDVNFKIIKEDISGFVATRYLDNYKYSSDDDISIEHKSQTGNYTMVANFKDNQFYFKDGKGNINPFTSQRVQYFLKRIDNTDRFISQFRTKSIKELLGSLEVLYRGNSGWGRWSFTRGLERFVLNYNNGMSGYQILANCGFERSFLRECINNRNSLNLKKTKPNEILGLSKSSLKVLRDLKLKYSHIEHLRKLDNLGGEKIRYIYEKVQEECGLYNAYDFLYKSEDYMLLIDKYKYDSKRLIDYLTREVKLQQGIDNPTEALTLLKDINKMCEDMEVKINEKYPKSLKKDHDIARLNYKVNSDSITERKFEKVVNNESYKKLKYKNNEFVVLLPNKPSDLIKEGDSLSHCVSSYIKDVCDERCGIYFARRLDNQNESLLTIEVRNSKIVQVRGKFNRHPTDKEKCFINSWAINKNLKINY